VIYLDHNATAPLRPEARRAMEPWLGRPANPMSPHALGREAAMAVDRARQSVADAVGFPRDGVIFTSGATESNTTLLSRGRWAASATEHPSVLAYAAAVIPVDGEGRVILGDLDGADGISVQAANNETGVVQDLPAVAAYARSRGLRLHVDAAQAPGRIALDHLRLADFVTISAHKIGGPQGVGALLARVPFEPLFRGGGQERGLRAGTHHVAGIVGLGAAIGEALPMSPALRDRLEAGLGALGGRVVGRDRLPNTSCVLFPGWEAADLVIALDLRGFCASAGAACASGAQRRSPVLAAMGIAATGLRLSLGPTTTAAEIDAVVAALGDILSG